MISACSACIHKTMYPIIAISFHEHCNVAILAMDRPWVRLYSHELNWSRDNVCMAPCPGETAYPGSQGSRAPNPRRDPLRVGSPIPRIPIFQSGSIHRAIPSRRERRTRRFKINRSYTRPTRLSRRIHTDHPRSRSLAGARTPVSRDGKQ